MHDPAEELRRINLPKSLGYAREVGLREAKRDLSARSIVRIPL
jgi:hypothetical protein